jgi:AraC-like DNA-binding protein
MESSTPIQISDAARVAALRVDVLETALASFHLTSTLYCALGTNRKPWGVALDASQGVQFHAVRDGNCWIRVENDDPVELHAGDFAIVPRGARHELIDDQRTTSVSAAELLARVPRPNRWVVELGGKGATSHLICAGFVCPAGAQFPLMTFLPKLIVLRASTTASLEPTLRLAEDEMHAPQVGTDAILTRLAEILLVEAVRTYVKTLRAADGGWLAALRDPKIATVLGLVHGDPAAGWTLRALSTAAATSRSSLAARFRRLVGMSVYAYIARVRMSAAATLLENPGHADLAAIASKIGYKSGPAFIRAFTREMGVSPGRYRGQMVTSATDAARPGSPE